LDTLGIVLACDTLDLAVSNNRSTITGIRDRPGQLNGADHYPQWLTCQLTSGPLTSGLDLVVALANNSGTCSWGTASSIEATIYKV
jgi:hypothetical protein